MQNQVENSLVPLSILYIICIYLYMIHTQHYALRARMCGVRKMNFVWVSGLYRILLLLSQEDSDPQIFPESPGTY